MRYPALRRLNAELASLTRYEFQHRCCDLLKEIWPGIVYSRELVGDFDRNGIDLHLPSNNLDESDFTAVIQCKGIEVPNFEETHLQQCFKSIGKFASSDFSATDYYLIVNRAIIESKWRDELNKRLDELIDSGKVKNALFLDISTFLPFLLKNIREILLSKIKALNNQHFTQYEEAMGKDVYIDSVPFIRENYRLNRFGEIKIASHKKSNPHKYLVDMYVQRAFETTKGQSSPKKLWTLVISEFGFGKTSLLLRLGIHLWNAKLPALYVPAVEMPARGFASERDMVRSFLRIILKKDEETSNGNFNIWMIALSSLLRSRVDLVLLIDGLDEHRDAYKQEGIRRMFDCLRDYACPIVLSMRQEFWDERQGNLQSAMKKPVYNREIIFLTDWGETTILRYVDEIQKKSSKSSSIKEFASLVSERRYAEVYGDIPRRPLFLSMLIEDLLSGAFRRMTLSRLYESYILRKMTYDLESPFGDTGRPLPLTEIDINDLRRRLLLILEQLALSTVVGGESNQVKQLLEMFPENLLKKAAESEGLPREPIIPFLLNTILVTAGSRSMDRELSIRFAHRSFQEYFIARRLVSILKEDTNENSVGYFSSQYPLGVVSFVYEVLRDIKIQPSQSTTFRKCFDRLHNLAHISGSKCLAAAVLNRF